MLPKILKESEVQAFKFWFNGALQEGLHYENELFYKALAVEAAKRTRLYHLGCKLAEKGGSILITVTDQSSSLWISLRNQELLAQVKENPVAGLPHVHL